MTRTESRSYLDHIYINNKSTVLSSSVPPIGMSDHCPVTVVRKHNGSFAKMNTHKTIKHRNYKNFDQASVCEDLVSAPWSLLHITDDPNEKLDLFEQVYTKVLNEHAPLIEKMVKACRQPPWFNDDIAKSIQERDSLLQLANKTKNEATMLLYKRARNDTTHLMRKAKQDFYIQSFKDNINNHKALWDPDF